MKAERTRADERASGRACEPGTIVFEGLRLDPVAALSWQEGCTGGDELLALDFDGDRLVGPADGVGALRRLFLGRPPHAFGPDRVPVDGRPEHPLCP